MEAGRPDCLRGIRLILVERVYIVSSASYCTRGILGYHREYDDTRFEHVDDNYQI